jgi:excisionase family DNA binding protein
VSGEDLKAAIREVLREELPRLLADVLGQAQGGDHLLDVDQAAARLGLSSSTVYKKAHQFEIPSVKIGGRVLFKPCDLDGYAEARRRSPERVRELAKGGA